MYFLLFDTFMGLHEQALLFELYTQSQIMGTRMAVLECTKKICQGKDTALQLAYLCTHDTPGQHNGLKWLWALFCRPAVMRLCLLVRMSAGYRKKLF